MPRFEFIHPKLPPMRLVSRNGRLYTGPCPFCADGGDDRFHVWMEASGGRPAERYWCRVCNSSGLLKNLDREEDWASLQPDPAAARTHEHQRPRVEPDPAHIPAYRQLYTATALWAHTWLLDECHPDPVAYLHGRGLADETISHYLLGVTLRDPESLVNHLRTTCPDAFPFAEEAGILVTDDSGRLLTHWNLVGRIVFPYIANGEVVDLRTRHYDGGKGYRSLGPYESRGAVFPFAWDSVIPGTKTVVITEAEFKSLAALQAYHAGRLDHPTLGQPGLTVFREAWARQLRDKGVEEVVLCYDSQPRTAKNGVPLLAPEEQWSLRHGAVCVAAGLQVRVARLPLRPGQDKEEIDAFLPREGPTRFQQLIDQAPLLYDYHRSISKALLDHHDLPVPSTYPVRRPRPTRLSIAEAQLAYQTAAPCVETRTIADVRAEIATLTEAHATDGAGFLVLAHPPGTGKGHNTTLGLKLWMQHTPTADDGGGFLVWTALRKEQIEDQHGIPLIPLHGRNPGNCRKLPEAAALAQKGYSVKDALCVRRCPHMDHCAYLRQFGQEGDFFASTPLLKATSWWERAGVIVLDEFDHTSLINHVQLSPADLAGMGRAHANKPAIQTMLRWIAQTLASTTDRTLRGTLFYEELARQASAEGAALEPCLQAALAELPPDEDMNRLAGLPTGATLAEYQALPPGHTATLLRQIDKELRLQLTGRPYTSRVEAREGRLELALRVEHLINQLARPDQPKIILDATANAGLLRAIFPHTPVQVEQPNIRGALRVVQVVGRDWAKSTLKSTASRKAGRRRERWFDDVASHIRPGHPTLVVCTLEWADELRRALAARGHPEVVVAHYGALRGSNAYKGYDVILAQVYHPNLEAIIREGRALFADDATPLDERVTVEPRLLRDATGASWRIQVPTFADPRLAALLENRREAEMMQCALRGRPFDHPDTQITLLFGLPLPGLPPTIIAEVTPSAESNGGRELAVKARLCATAQHLIERGTRVIDVAALAAAAQVSVVTVRKHWGHVAARVHLTMLKRRRQVAMPRGGLRHYERMVLVQRGRAVNGAPAQGKARAGEPETRAAARPLALELATMDHADNRRLITRVIRHQPRRRRLRRAMMPRQGPGRTGRNRTLPYRHQADGSVFDNHEPSP